MNIAEQRIEYYQSEDFESNYFCLLAERFFDNKDEVEKQINKIINVDYNIFDYKNIIFSKTVG